ncbi:MAG: hypothetical protein Q9M33_03955 [Robiginitomaculum sp.]|nr:hypothetical protein [Robiginitomaculum sp.]MDQ7077400.1 hypothetical protein [Robiginitomaculum sp.]
MPVWINSIRHMLWLVCWLGLSGVAFAQDADWRPVKPENLLLIKTAYGQVAVELNPVFAPPPHQTPAKAGQSTLL